MTPSTAGKKRGQSHTQNDHDETLYSLGMYVAFIDASDSLEKFKIAQVPTNLFS